MNVVVIVGAFLRALTIFGAIRYILLRVSI
jgi:hypothetical protein